jgi:HTH-type transcriptional regulator, sugar sensing transcriptional regulator
MEKRDKKIAETLVSFGLSKKESGVYVATLALGHGTVSVISRKAGINRTTGYDILSSLAVLGLVRISGKEPKQEYIAESPDNLIAMLERRLEETELAIEKVKTFVPELKTIHTVTDRPQIKFYEGIEGMKQVYEDTLTSTEEIRAYGNYDEVYDVLKNYFPKYYQRRAAKGIHIRGIAPRTHLSEERQRMDEKEGRELTLVNPGKYSLSPEIDIYDNKVMIASWREKLGIIIESAEIADAMKKIFELAWIGAKQVEEKD